jgi:bifunctional ADP-heptose synthase (sugar kinase/adenylyltransferase)
MAVFEQGRRPIHIPTLAREVFDVTGAGDTVIAAACLALLCGATIREAALIANASAGIVVGKIGTAAATPRELLATLAAD